MSAGDEAQKQEGREPRIPYSGWLPLAGGLLCGVLLRWIFSAKPGSPFQTMAFAFVMLAPFVIGAVTVALAERERRRTWTYCFVAGMTANLLLVAGAFVTMIEGLICVVLAAPVFGILGGVGGLLMGAFCRLSGRPKHRVLGIAALPLLLGPLEHQLPLPNEVRTVERSLLVSASPEQVWLHLVDTPDIARDEIERAWMYRIGVPTPVSGRTELTPEGPVRRVRMGKGIRFDQIAREWEPGRRVRWVYRFDEHSVPPGALDDHVAIGGHHFDLVDTTYTLVPEGAGTRLHVGMTYRISTNYNWYVRPLADFLVGNFEEAVLELYAHRAAAGGRSPAGG